MNVPAARANVAAAHGLTKSPPLVTNPSRPFGSMSGSWPTPASIICQHARCVRSRMMRPSRSCTAAHSMVVISLRRPRDSPHRYKYSYPWALSLSALRAIACGLRQASDTSGTYYCARRSRRMRIGLDTSQRHSVEYLGDGSLIYGFIGGLKQWVGRQRRGKCFTHDEVRGFIEPV